MMDTRIVIGSAELTKTDLTTLLQAVRDCEQAHFRNKQIMIFVDAPKLSSDEIMGIITGLQPSFPNIHVVPKER